MRVAGWLLMHKTTCVIWPLGFHYLCVCVCVCKDNKWYVCHVDYQITYDACRLHGTKTVKNDTKQQLLDR